MQRAAAAADAAVEARVLTCGEWVLVFKPAAPPPPGCDGPHKIFDSMPCHSNIPAVPLPPPDVRDLTPTLRVPFLPFLPFLPPAAAGSAFDRFRWLNGLCAVGGLVSRHCSRMTRRPQPAHLLSTLPTDSPYNQFWFS